MLIMPPRKKTAKLDASTPSDHAAEAEVASLQAELFRQLYGQAVGTLSTLFLLHMEEKVKEVAARSVPTLVSNVNECTSKIKDHEKTFEQVAKTSAPSSESSSIST